MSVIRRGPVYPLTVYTWDSISSYPHMAKRDANVWEKYLKAHGAEYIGFSYDVALGGRQLALEGMREEESIAWQYSTALKIDVVGWKANQAWIIEVRPDATVGTLGAALCYTLVAQREQLSELPLVPAICYESIQIDVEWCCQQTGVQLLKV
jgi:hypothetical protein